MKIASYKIGLSEGRIMQTGNFFENVTTATIIASIVDLLIVWYVIYLLITVMKGTKAIQLIKGIFLILIGRSISNFFDLTTTTQMFDCMMERWQLSGCLK